jgi:hypothetical protein
MAIDTNEWLHEHIPHRVRGVLVGTGLLPEFGKATTWPDCDPVQWRFITDAGWESRIICVRWLIEFVGIKMGKIGPEMPKRMKKNPATHDFDVGIEAFDPSALYPLGGPHALRFAETWQAASKASAHVTAEKVHPLLEDRDRNLTTIALINHLSATIYGNSDEWLKLYVFNPG